jgi:hypothetical protein
MEQVTTLFSSTILVDANRLLGILNPRCVKENMPFSKVKTLKGSMCQHCPKAIPSSIPHNYQLSPSIEVSLCILKLGCGELPFAHHINLVASSFHG